MRYSTWSLIVLFSSLVAFAPPAGAVDTVVLINQATSVNGLPGCPHAGFPILICHSGSYRLAGNLHVSAVNIDAIDIGADNVTLNLNGFAISGPSVCTRGTFPVQCTNSGSGTGVLTFTKNAAVRNGTVRGFGTGVTLAGPGSVVDSVRAESNSSAAGIVINGIVTHCTSTTNAGDGISAVSFEATVSQNSVSFNGGFGIFAGGNVFNNNVFQNGQDGIHNAVGAFYNTAFSNFGAGIANDRADFGYMGNVIFSNHGGAVVGGQSMGHNLCDGVAC